MTTTTISRGKGRFQCQRTRDNGTNRESRVETILLTSECIGECRVETEE